MKKKREMTLKEYIDGIYYGKRYYQEHKEELLKVVTEEGKTAWICTVCGYIYYGEEIPKDFKCPTCGVDNSFFERK